jgi:2-keto-4-pentenoate hydratase/2-oxohepta-3-ene-1,7-dioic acid hydratase in catechol pathway
MRLVRFGPPGAERPGVWMPDAFGPGRHGVLDVRAGAFDIEDFDAHFFGRWGLDRLRGLLAEDRKNLLPAENLRLGPPVARPGKIICLGKNYADHAAEFDAEAPTSPILFSKATTSLIGPADPVVIPPGASRVDAEAELALVIGRRARRVEEIQALEFVAGYAALNDVTDRDAQRDGRQWFRGKSCDTFCPMGPWLVTADELGDPRGLRVYSKLNGRILQDGNTKDMIFPIPHLIAFISRSITLEPGDVISTGTPAGVGFARKPPQLLNAGDVIEVGVDRIGELRNPVTAS